MRTLSRKNLLRWCQDRIDRVNDPTHQGSIELAALIAEFGLIGKAVTRGSGLVYFLRVQGTTIRKIGFTTNPLARERANQTGSSASLIWEYSVRGDRTLEKRLHTLNRKSKTRDKNSSVKGEWFDLTTCNNKRDLARLVTEAKNYNRSAP